MTLKRTTSDDYQPLKGRVVKKNDYQTKDDYQTMSSRRTVEGQISQVEEIKQETQFSLRKKTNKDVEISKNELAKQEQIKEVVQKKVQDTPNPDPLDDKHLKQIEKNSKYLEKDRWGLKKGHKLTFIGLYLFTFFVYFRPYELIPGAKFLSVFVLPLALFTLGVYFLTQLANEGTLSSLSTEVKCVLGILALAILTMPISRDISIAWEAFNDTFIKAILIFVVLANVIRTKKQLVGLIWIGLGIGIYLSFNSLYLFSKGEFITEGYRVSAEVKGMFENPNEMSLHLVMMIPIAIALGITTKNKLSKVLYFTTVGLFLITNTITYSRGGFLSLIGLSLVLFWKLGRDNRLKSIVIVAFFGILLLAIAPGEYTNRLLSIFDHSRDAVGSASARQENLILSIISTLRNPWGIGIGNSVTFGVHNLETHNAFTQVSSELGVIGLILYLIFLISPYKKLSAIQNILGNQKKNWTYYLSIGLQASLVAYMIGSFFASVAYNWFAYYLVAYTIAVRRIYMTEQSLIEKDNQIESN